MRQICKLLSVQRIALIILDFFAVYLYFAAIRLIKTRNNIQHCRFSRAVAAENTNCLAAIRFKIYTAQNVGQISFISEPNIFKLDCRIGFIGIF